MLDDVARERGCADILVVDNGPELTGRDLKNWAHQNGVKLFFIDPSKARRPLIRFPKGTRPAGRGGANRCRTVRSCFNGRFRDECLDPHWFRSLDGARRIIERWRIAYNEIRPHTALRMVSVRGTGVISSPLAV